MTHIESALVYIFTDDGRKTFKGCGALVEGGFVATCRHIWRQATENEKRANVVVTFPKIRGRADADEIRAGLAHACEDGAPDLVLLTAVEMPRDAIQLPVARAAKFTYGSAFALAPLPSENRRDIKIAGEIDDYRSGPDELQRFSCATSTTFWIERGASGAPVFLDQGMQLAGLMTLAYQPEDSADVHASRLREAFVIPGDIIWSHVAAAMALRVATEEQVPAASLSKLLEELGHQGVSVVDIPARLTEAFAAMKAAAAVPVAKSNVGGDVDETIAAAREKLGNLDPQGALALLRGKRDEVSELRQDAVRREVALLAEQAEIERLAFDHAAALSTLGQIMSLDPENDQALVEAGAINVVIGNRLEARRAFDRALAIAEAKNEPHRIGVALDRIGTLRMAEGDLVGALAAHSKSLTVVEYLAGLDPSDMHRQRELSVSHNKIGDVRMAEGDRVGALDAYGKGLEIAEGLAKHDPGNALWRRDLLISHSHIGDVRLAEGDNAGALDAYGKSLVNAENLAKRDPCNTEWQRDLSVSYDRIGNSRMAEGDRVGALEAYDKSLVIREDLAKRDPGNTDWQRDLSISLSKIGDVRMAEDDPAGARDVYGRCLAIREDLARRDTGNTHWQRDLAVGLWRLALVEPDSAATWRRVVAIFERLAADNRLASPDRDHLAEARRQLAAALDRKGR